MSQLPTDALHVVATIPTKPDAVEAVRSALSELGAATRAEEGCLAYAVYESAAVPGVFLTVEAWRQQADLDAHMQTAHIATAFEVLGDALVGEVVVHPLNPLV